MTKADLVNELAKTVEDLTKKKAAEIFRSALPRPSIRFQTILQNSAVPNII